jgi:predicted Zn-dependent peptidase
VIALVASAAGQSLPFERYQLANGLEVMLMEDHRLPQVVVDTWYRVGSKDEKPGRSGFAHLFEHLMFMGTDRLPGSGIDQTMEAYGGWNNAWTMEDATNYYDVGPPGLLATFLWIEADRMESLGRAMTQEKLDLQREVVRNERRQSSEDTPYGMVEIEAPSLLFPTGHPYAHTVIGTHEDLVAASLQDVKEFFATWYVPNNAALVVAGDFDGASARALIERYFAAIPSRPLPDRVRAVPATGPQKAAVTITDQVEFPKLNLLWHVPAAYSEDAAALTLVAGLLGEGDSSRLNRRLVLGGLAQEVDVTHYPLQHGGVFAVSAIPAEGTSMARLEAVVHEELLRLANEPPAAQEVERVRNQHRFSFLSSLESLQERAELLNRYLAYTGDPDYLKKQLAKFDSVDAGALQGVAARWLGPATAARIAVTPEAP